MCLHSLSLYKKYIRAINIYVNVWIEKGERNEAEVRNLQNADMTLRVFVFITTTFIVKIFVKYI